jgi:hypothetical protein
MKKKYEYNHTIWHLLNGSASIIVSVYGENEERIRKKINNTYSEYLGETMHTM